MGGMERDGVKERGDKTETGLKKGLLGRKLGSTPRSRASRTPSDHPHLSQTHPNFPPNPPPSQPHCPRRSVLTNIAMSRSDWNKQTLTLMWRLFYAPPIGSWEFSFFPPYYMNVELQRSAHPSQNPLHQAASRHFWCHQYSKDNPQTIRRHPRPQLLNYNLKVQIVCQRIYI